MHSDNQKNTLYNRINTIYSAKCLQLRTICRYNTFIFMQMTKNQYTAYKKKKNRVRICCSIVRSIVFCLRIACGFDRYLLSSNVGVSKLHSTGQNLSVRLNNNHSSSQTILTSFSYLMYFS